MRYEDSLYGAVEIYEPVLLALFDSTAVQRLQNVLQHGISSLVGITGPINRFEHSVGVVLLVRRFGGSLQEQIAALLHDVSHTAFSHVIDYVVNQPDQQSYHETMKSDYLSRTDLPAILRQFGYDWHAFIHEDGYWLLEQELPDLCADRLDYFLRDADDLGLVSPSERESLLAHLRVHEGRFVVDDLDIARWLAYTFITADKASWASVREVGLYEVTARALRHALEVEVITGEDFWSTDRQVWEKLRSSADPGLHDLMQWVSAQTQFILDDQNPTFRISTKLRSIDPKVLSEGHVLPLSALDSEFAAYRANYLTSRQGKWPIRVMLPSVGR